MSSYKLSLALLAVVGLASAIPNGNAKSSTAAKSSTSAKTTTTTTTSAAATPSYFALPQVARFENDNNLGAPIVAAEPVNIYDDILFNGFTGIVDSDPSGIGILTQSPANSISYGPLLTATAEQGPATMTTVYQDTTVAFFDLASLYYGCVLNDEESVFTLLASCDITATCLNPKGQQVARQDFSFVNNGALSQQMDEAVFKGFKGCQVVEFNTSSAAGVDIATCFDTISYTVYSQLPLSP